NTTGDGQAGGGLSGGDTSSQQKSRCSAHITITNLPGGLGLNDGPVNNQKGATPPAPPGQSWGVVNSEMMGTTCTTKTLCKGAGVSGAGLNNWWVGNYVHDINDKVAAHCPGNAGCSTDFENHGFYLEGNGSYEVAFNRIENIFGGNGIQTNGTAGTVGG